jgi:hypothetical protein
MLDGTRIGTTDAEGVLVFGPVQPGKHEIVVRKSRHREERRDLTIAAGSERSVEVMLTLLPGTLSVSSNVADAEVRVGSSKVYTGRVDGLELAPGRYEVTVSKLGYRAYAGTVNLEAGGSARIDAALEPLAPKALVALAEDEFVGEHYDRVVALCEMVLAEKPNRPRANLLLGASYLRTGRSADSVAPLLKAVEGGERVAAPVHQRRATLGTGQAPGLLILGRNEVTFRSPDDPGLDFAVQLRGVRRVGGTTSPLLLAVDVDDSSRVPADTGLCLLPCASVSELPGRKGRGKKRGGDGRPSRPRSVKKKDRRGDADGSSRMPPEEIEYVADAPSQAALDVIAQLLAQLRRR